MPLQYLNRHRWIYLAYKAILSDRSCLVLRLGESECPLTPFVFRKVFKLRRLIPGGFRLGLGGRPGAISYTAKLFLRISVSSHFATFIGRISFGRSCLDDFAAIPYFVHGMVSVRGRRQSYLKSSTEHLASMLASNLW